MRATEFVSWTKGEKGICSIAKGEIFNPAGHFNIDGVVDAMILNPYDLQVMPCPLLFREFIIRDIFVVFQISIQILTSELKRDFFG